MLDTLNCTYRMAGLVQLSTNMYVYPLRRGFCLLATGCEL